VGGDAVKLGALYHWSPTDRRTVIRGEGLKPYQAPTVCTGDQVSCYLSLSPDVRAFHAHGEDDWVACSSSDLSIGEARLYVKKEVLNFDDESIDRIIAHELLHPLLDRVLDHVHLLREYVPSPVFDAYMQGRTGDEEELVNRLAHVISTHGEHGKSPYLTKRVRG
jgi:hypothetical protein